MHIFFVKQSAGQRLDRGGALQSMDSLHRCHDPVQPQWHLDKPSNYFFATFYAVGIRPKVGGIW